jgi:hypothetical protein
VGRAAAERRARYFAGAGALRVILARRARGSRVPRETLAQLDALERLEATRWW